MTQEYKNTITWMVEQLPMYQKLGKVAFNAGLDNIEKLDKHLKHPHKQFDSIHIAGTNGKGSTSHMLASILQEAGYKVGLYTSPHLKDYRERIRVNGELISEEAVVQFIDTNRGFLKQNAFSFFEMSVGMAFDYFAKSKVDIAIIETGLGGRLDSTNIITPLLSIITNIGLDHLGVLGNSLEAIAKEKAGIIKRNTPVVIGEYTDETKPIFHDIAMRNEASTHYVNHDQALLHKLDLKGLYQEYNARTVIKAIEVLNNLNLKYSIAEKTISNGLKRVVKNTGLMGRWQVLKETPLTICDTAHNAHALLRVAEQIKKQKYEQLHIVIGMVSDKEADGILALLPKQAIYYFCAPAIDRALDVKELQTIASKYGLKGITYPTTSKAYQAAIENSTKKDMIFIGGSNFIVSEIL
ncbi:MAG TPA: folylpolyglutamate synthase/dihydrofolate synthase family protein [Flavobacteriaceae bacterium]|nr:folylpolyglutamate synthase/dihydrofolate synthase family protein [Flavobacteriaceae bacterium]